MRRGAKPGLLLGAQLGDLSLEGVDLGLNRLGLCQRREVRARRGLGLLTQRLDRGVGAGWTATGLSPGRERDPEHQGRQQQRSGHPADPRPEAGLDGQPDPPRDGGCDAGLCRVPSPGGEQRRPR